MASKSDPWAVRFSDPSPSLGWKTADVKSAVKVHYTFDREGQINCLARHPHTIHVQTMALDETNTIGVVDLRLCIQAVAECSPELASQECDYTIYARDYSEFDTPLVGQGMLSWALDALRSESGGQQSKMVTGRVVKNVLGVFGNGNKEILEVRLRLTETIKVQRSMEGSRHIERPMSHPPQLQAHQQQQVPQQPQPQRPQHPLQQQHEQQQQQILQQQASQQTPSQSRPIETVMTPTGTAEWNSFMQSNPHIGQHSAYSRVASPALSQGRPVSKAERRDSFIQPAPEPGSQGQLPQLQPTQPQQTIQRVAPTPVDTTTDAGADAIPSAPPSRPTSRASTTRRRPRKPPTGRPRGRPRKKAPDGNTSGYEDGTEGEDGGPAKKRAKTTQVDKTSSAPFGAGPDSLRVAASTSGSLRNFRPVNMSGEAAGGSHLQEIPRVPTPVPQGLPGSKLGGNKAPVRRESSMMQEMSMSQPSPQNEMSQTQAFSPLDDGRSPELAAPTPAFSDFSATDMASSPPVPRRASSIGCAMSSPTLPPMPNPSRDDEGPDDIMEDLFGNEPVLAQPLPKAPVNLQPCRDMKPALNRIDSTLPMQVFRMDPGPDGQSMVQIGSFGPPEANSFTFPTSDAAGPMKLARPQPATQKPRQQQPSNRPSLPPTPPLTTDAPEKAPSPAVVPNCVAERPQAEATIPANEQVAPSIEDDAATAQVQPMHTAGQPDLAPLDQGHDVSMSDLGASFDGSVSFASQPAGAVSESVPSGKASKPKPAPRQLVRSQSANIQMQLPKAQTEAPPKPSLPRRAASTLPASMARPRGGADSTMDLPASGINSRSAGSGRRQAEGSVPPMPASDSPAVDLTASKAAAGAVTLPVPASDPVVPASALVTSFHLPQPLALPTAMPLDPYLPPPSSPVSRRSNKNKVKKETIRLRLEEAISRGEQPLYCTNCGAIETPTWRKIWVQDRLGPPPTDNMVKGTVYETIQADKETGEPTAHRVCKKNLDPGDVASQWDKKDICNPCGLWLSKGTEHRPMEQWDKDAGRRGQERKRRAPGPRARKPRSKSDVQASTLSEGLLPADPATDGIAPLGATSPVHAPGAMGRAATEPTATQGDAVVELDDDVVPPAESMVTVSDHSKGDGTAKSPITLDLDDEMGPTKRLLFPSPRKDNSPKVLSDVDINIVHVSSDARHHRELEAVKDTSAVGQQKLSSDGEDLEALFRSPLPPRPSTPTQDAGAVSPAAVFKTPTRSTPNRRPMTRSVSRSQRTVRSWTSPNKLQKTPSKTPSRTPRGHLNPPQTPLSRRRSPRHQPNTEFGESEWNTPISRAITQMLSDNPLLSDGNFAAFSDDMDFNDLPPMDDQAMAGAVDSWFSTDPDMMGAPTSPQWYEGSKQVVDDWNEKTNKEFMEQCVKHGV